MAGRSCHAIELSPAYCDVAVQRWQAFTGQEATLEVSDRSFAEIAVERAEAGKQAVTGRRQGAAA
jgi:hypothetical protein